jgi:hypothetical protein
MTVAKAVVRGVLLASVAASSARGGSMLVLGVTYGDGTSSQATTTPASSFQSFGPTGSAPALRLGVSSDSNPSVFSPAPASPAPAPAPPPPAPSIIPPPTIHPATSFVAPALPSNPARYDAFINLDSGPYASSSGLTVGNPQAWYLSAPVDRLFGGVPNDQQRLAFDNTVLQRVRQTFGLSGVPVSLTDDPNASAAHTLSVVSQATNPSLGAAIGMTYLGGNGFHYIDNSANASHSVDQLEWIVAHNLAHELMLAFNVPEIHDTTGNFVDAGNASWSMMTGPNSTFSPDAVTDLLSRNFQSTGGSVLYPGAQLLGPSTVPEPSTLVLWGLIASAGVVAGCRRRRSIGPKA